MAVAATEPYVVEILLFQIHTRPYYAAALGQPNDNHQQSSTSSYSKQE
jgi:hypothetical protein